MTFEKNVFGQVSFYLLIKGCQIILIAEHFGQNFQILFENIFRAGDYTYY